MEFSSIWSHLAFYLHIHKWLLYCLHWNRSYSSGMCHSGDAYSAHAYGMDYPVTYSYNHEPLWKVGNTKHRDGMDR
jgi:hypothetical protein